jgi:hypothetical protein
MAIKSKTTTAQFAITETGEQTVHVASESSSNKTSNFKSLQISSINTKYSISLDFRKAPPPLTPYEILKELRKANYAPVKKSTRKQQVNIFTFSDFAEK